jgi:hypothetical protein
MAGTLSRRRRQEDAPYWPGFVDAMAQLLLVITFLLSESNYDAEVKVIKEMKALGGKTLVVAQRIRDRARAAADIVVELDCDLPEPPCEPDRRGSSRRWRSR